MLRQGAMEYLHLARRQCCWRDGFECHAVHSLKSAHCKGPMQLPTGMLPSESRDDAQIRSRCELW